MSLSDSSSQSSSRALAKNASAIYYSLRGDDNLTYKRLCLLLQQLMRLDGRPDGGRHIMNTRSAGTSTLTSRSLDYLSQASGKGTRPAAPSSQCSDYWATLKGTSTPTRGGTLC